MKKGNANDLKKAYSISGSDLYKSLFILEKKFWDESVDRQDLINLFCKCKEDLEHWMQEWKLCDQIIPWLETYRDSTFESFIIKILEVTNWSAERSASEVAGEYVAQQVVKSVQNDLNKFFQVSINAYHELGVLKKVFR